MKKLIPALCLLLISAILMGTSTYAWFSMNNQVTATGMQVTAKADSGIVIKYTGDSTATFTTKADVAETTANELYPTSTVDLTNWYKGSSSQKDDAEAGQPAANYTAVGSGEVDNYYKKYDFIVRSSSQNVPVNNVKLAVNSFTVAKVGSTATSENLDKAVRLGVLCNGTFYIYAPLADANVTIAPLYTYDTTKSDKVGETTCTASNGDQFTIPSNSIPASDTGITVSIFVWFEGEDENCKSSNVTATLDKITVEVVFQTVDVA